MLSIYTYIKWEYCNFINKSCTIGLSHNVKYLSSWLAFPVSKTIYNKCVFPFLKNVANSCIRSDDNFWQTYRHIYLHTLYLNTYTYWYIRYQSNLWDSTISIEFISFMSNYRITDIVNISKWPALHINTIKLFGLYLQITDKQRLIAMPQLINT